MSKTAFQSRITLDSGYFTDGEMKVWVCNTTFVDYDAVYTGLDITIGDVVAIDTAMYEPGTFTLYAVTNIVTPDPTSPVIEITYMATNDNSWGAPALDSLFGFVQTIARPTVKLGLLPVVSKDTQAVSDKYTEYVQNYNFVKIVDNLISGDMTFTKINGETYPLIKGMAVYITEIDQAHCKTAVATAIASSRVLGLVADAAVIPGGTVTISSKGMLEKPVNDWDIITGESGGLRAGMDYFLRTDLTGGISSTPPTAVNNFVVKVGKAISPTVLDINIEPPIEL